MSGFVNGQVCALATHVERGESGNRLFMGASGFILDVFGIDRVLFKNNGNLLMVQVFLRPPQREVR